MHNVITLPPSPSVAQEAVKDQVYRHLRDGLMAGRFAPGQRLTIRGLAEALGSSPMPVDEALRRLQAEGAFEFSGTARFSVGQLSEPQLRDVRDARVALEGLLAERAASRMTRVDDAEVTQLYGRLQVAADAVDGSAYLWMNFAFHRRIYQIAQAPMILGAVENFWLLIGPCFVLVAPDAAHLQRSMDAHRRILDALLDRDTPAARAAVTDDIMQAANCLSRLLDKAAKERSVAAPRRRRKDIST
ncbi:GntR family transcriptional regulator [Bradyrhizobium jicamae]|uniref:GntR family transcriptional regulator n=1 Tax=Bradyrhizobium jicamae TaxID=280332 RepID=A0A0R3LJJ9_9BRAD|nr:GntR family transcriptional regulator [Bradyrhizobium jicamae]KRR07962.1 GntR family transcriptional regulator [Bradyrhizobium jicamae]